MFGLLMASEVGADQFFVLYVWETIVKSTKCPITKNLKLQLS